MTEEDGSIEYTPEPSPQLHRYAVRCRLTNPPGEHKHGLDSNLPWTVELREAIDLASRESHDLGGYLSHTRTSKLVEAIRLRVADLVAVCYELEGEKAALLSDRRDDQDPVDTMYLGRTLKVFVDSQLEHLTRLANLCTNLAFYAVSSHPRVATLDTDALKRGDESDKTLASELKAAKAFPKEACWNCHNEHAKTDNVFVQFYPTLRD